MPPISAVLQIDLDAVARNYRLLQKQSPGKPCAAAVKADAYGLGMARIVPALHKEGCRWFFVATAQEALTFSKTFDFEAQLGVFNGFHPQDCADPRVVPILNTPDDLARWRGTGRPVIVHVDTGINRLGLGFDIVDSLDFSGLDVVCIMSHLACASLPDHPLNPQQLARFRELRTRFPKASASLANSSGIFLESDYHFDLLRPGAALYGLNPHETGENPMHPVVRLDVPVLQIREVSAPATVGYGATYAIKGRQRLATIAAGYADGLLRILGNKGRVFYQGQALPIAGRVSMDLIVVDATALPENALKAGDMVEVLGPNQSPDDLAAAAGTIGYEILTGLGARYERHYDGAENTERNYEHNTAG